MADKGKKESGFGDVLLGLVIIFGVSALVGYFGSYLWLMKAIGKAILFTGIVFLGLTAVSKLIQHSVIQVPEYHFAVISRLSERTGRVLLEGTYFVIPLIDKFFKVSMQRRTIEIDAEFKCADDQHLCVSGSLDHRFDPRVVGKHGWNEGRSVIQTLSRGSVDRVVVDFVKKALQAVGAAVKSKDFFNNFPAVDDYLNCMLRFSVPPHLRHNAATCGVPKCKMPPGDVGNGKLLRFYKTHRSLVKKELEGEAGEKGDFSSMEKHCGIDCEKFILADINHTAEQKAALAMKKQVEARSKANETRMDTAEELIKRGLSTKERALDDADVVLTPDVAKKEIKRQSFDGLGDKKPDILIEIE